MCGYMHVNVCSLWARATPATNNGPASMDEVRFKHTASTIFCTPPDTHAQTLEGRQGIKAPGNPGSCPQSRNS